MSPLPLPVRIAAGLVATAVDQACKLPAQLTGLPVTVVSHALQASMRVQQQITELAIKGDQVFAQLRPVEDTASWARFDEDEVDAGRNGDPGGRATAFTPGGFATAPPAPEPMPTPGELDEADVARALSPHSGPGTPEAMPGYDEMSLPQLRGKLRGLSLQQLDDLLAHEHAHQVRPAFVTMLSNRIDTVRSR